MQAPAPAGKDCACQREGDNRLLPWLFWWPEGVGSSLYFDGVRCVMVFMSVLKRVVIPVAFLLLIATLIVVGGRVEASQGESPASSASQHAADAPQAGVQTPPILWSLPFVFMLLAIAVFPLVPQLHHTWERNRVKLGLGLLLGSIVVLHYALRGFGVVHGDHATVPGWPTVSAVLNHAILEDYVPFLTLLFSLYVIAGGIQLRGDLRALPSVNTVFLGLGALLASFVGTTGASMVLIRPVLQTNQERTRVVHTVVFFIFLVSNIGGSLLPLGDPPLFLGFLKGVPFFWTLSLWLPWLFCVAVLLMVYYLWDRLYEWPREPLMAQMLDRKMIEPLRMRGWINILWLLVVVGVVALLIPGKPFLGTGWIVPRFLREVLLLGLVGASLTTTPAGLRKDVQFNYHAILEVAALFLGIFLTMQVPLEVLRAQGPSLGLRTPMQFFWWTGILSSFLDNAPTYLVFLATAQTLPLNGMGVLQLTDGSVGVSLLRAISLGAVFMGANTYIGNGPNFMVKSIAERQGVKMPSFFGYMIYSAVVLLPLHFAVGWLFLR